MKIEGFSPGRWLEDGQGPWNKLNRQYSHTPVWRATSPLWNLLWELRQTPELKS